MRGRAAAIIFLVVAAAWPAQPAGAQVGLERVLSQLAPVFGEPSVYDQREGKEEIFVIARRYGVSASAVHNANVGDLLAGGETLLIPTEHIAPLPWAEGIVVNLTERNLYLYQHGLPVRCFPVAIGKRGWETPTGEYTIINKAVNPTWFPPAWAVEEEPVPAGADNPLGDRWMGLSIRGYGIHATNKPASIGRYVSHGCIRMYPEQVHELFDLVGVGTPVQIIYARIVFGFRPEEGVVYMAHYPDSYRFGEVRPEHVRRQLAEYGLDQVLDMEAVERALERPRGAPTAVIGSRTRVVVNGRPVEFALGPTRRGEDWLAPAAPLVTALGATMEVGQGAGYFLIRRSMWRVFLSPGDAAALVNGRLVPLGAAPQVAAGYPMVPVRGLAEALGATVEWDEEADTIVVEDREPWRAAGERIGLRGGGPAGRSGGGREREREREDLPQH